MVPVPPEVGLGARPPVRLDAKTACHDAVFAVHLVTLCGCKRAVNTLVGLEAGSEERGCYPELGKHQLGRGSQSSGRAYL